MITQDERDEILTDSILSQLVTLNAELKARRNYSMNIQQQVESSITEAKIKSLQGQAVSIAEAKKFRDANPDTYDYGNTNNF